MTFEEFLVDRGYKVERNLQPSGEIYVIDGYSVHYKDIPASPYASLLRQYLAKCK